MLNQAVISDKWLFSARIDLGVFLGSAAASFVALIIGARAGALYGETPDWAWVPAILMIDVAHVYATAYRVYFDVDEFRRRPWLYVSVPALGLMLGIALYSESEVYFWRALAYLAVFHFVRQQYGWVALYRAKAGERDRLGHLLDSAAIYISTIYPLIYWHANLPREFWWFLKGDFAPIPSLVEGIARPFYWAILAAYGLRSLYRFLARGLANPGKDIVVATTAACWHVGIISFNSDYAFTVTNVIIHGVPYIALVYWYARHRRDQLGRAYRFATRWPVVFLATLWLLAYAEELLWDRVVWHERSWLFGRPWDVPLKVVWVPLLALPQLVHYVLDGFIWRRRDNPNLSSILL